MGCDVYGCLSLVPKIILNKFFSSDIQWSNIYISMVLIKSKKKSGGIFPLSSTTQIRPILLDILRGKFQIHSFVCEHCASPEAAPRPRETKAIQSDASQISSCSKGPLQIKNCWGNSHWTTKSYERTGVCSWKRPGIRWINHLLSTISPALL